MTDNYRLRDYGEKALMKLLRMRQADYPPFFKWFRTHVGFSGFFFCCKTLLSELKEGEIKRVKALQSCFLHGLCPLCCLFFIQVFMNVLISFFQQQRSYSFSRDLKSKLYFYWKSSGFCSGFRKGGSMEGALLCFCLRWGFFRLGRQRDLSIIIIS